jgi:hypothetical protein
VESEWNLIVPLLFSALVICLEVVIQRLFVTKVVVILEMVTYCLLVLGL